MCFANCLKSIVPFGTLILAGCYGGGSHREERVVYRRAPEPVIVERREPVVVERVVVVERPAEVVVTTFYDDLAPHGRWIEIGNYGRCWYPNGISRGWRPYTVGQWVYTDYGWSWESEETWGFATYHYGRWFEDDRYGWVWQPGSTWAPAWVAWRSGGGYVGWAPLGPSIRFGVHISEVETRDIPASRFCFVEERRINERRVSNHVVNIERNTTIINKTTNITNITVVNKRVVNQSLSVENVERATGKKVERVTVKEVDSSSEARKPRGKAEVTAYRPKVLVKEAEAERTRPAENKQREAERTKPAETKQQEAARIKREEAEKTKAAEAKRPEAERVKREQDPRSRPAETKQQEAARIKREEAEKAKAAEAKRPEAERIKREQDARPRPGETKEQAAERVRKEEAKRKDNEDRRDR